MTKEEELDQRYKECIHNIKYYLKQIGIYLDTGQYKKIADVLSELQIEIHQQEKDSICSNRFLNALLLDFKNEAVKKDIRADIFVEAGFKIEFVKEQDLISILGNLLDNAIEAAQKCEKGWVSAAMYMENGGSFSVCRIENTYTGEIRQRGDRMLTTKTQARQHGIGLQNVKRLIREYSGYLHQEYENGIYITTVILPRKGGF